MKSNFLTYTQKKNIQKRIDFLNSWIKTYKTLGQYHQRYHAENEVKRLNKLLSDSKPFMESNKTKP